jgi:4-hydroxybenzoate polyprenyltransferase
MQDFSKKIIPFLKLIRYPNLTIIILTQLLTYYFITDWYLVHSFFPKGILLLITGSVLIAAAGYLINDFFDFNIDQINKPEKVLVNVVFSKKFVLLSYSFFNLIALLLALLIDKQIFFFFIFTIMLLLLYSAYFKRLYLLGNLVVSVTLALTVYVVWIYCPIGNFAIVLFYMSFAFLSSLIREIIKDVEDLEGDREMDCLTLPVVAGVKAARNITFIIIVFLVFLIEFSALYLYLSSSANSIFSAIYLNIFVVIPLVLIGFKLLKATERKDFHRISRYIKFVMLAGILSMISINIT